jgi:hypothetical protein
MIPLMIGLQKIMNDSMEVSREVLDTWHTNRNIRKKYSPSPLQDLLVNLASLHETSSQESQDLDKQKGKQISQVSYNPSTTEPPSTPRSSQPCYPTSYQTPDNKRKVSEASLETRSALTTPKKLLQPEAKIQALQKDFIEVILNKVYYGHVGIYWAKGRHMHLSYHECISITSLLMIVLALPHSNIPSASTKTRLSQVASKPQRMVLSDR